MTLLKRVRYVCYYVPLTSVVAFMSFVMARNFGPLFCRLGKMYGVGRIMADLGHVLIWLLLLGLLAISYRLFFRLSWNHFRANSRLLLICLLPALPIAFLSAAISLRYLPPQSRWHLRCGISSDAVFLPLAALCFVSILLYVRTAWKRGVFRAREHSQSLTILGKPEPQLFVLICLVLIPSWGDGYWLALTKDGGYWLWVLKNEYVSSLSYSYFTIPLVFVGATLVIHKRLECSKASFYLSQLNVVLLYFCTLGYVPWRPFRWCTQSLAAIVPLSSAAFAWALNWMIWHKDLSDEDLRVLTPLRVRCALATLTALVLWQFISYFWYADSRLQQVAWRFAEEWRGRGGICIRDFDALPHNQRKYLLKQLSGIYGKVYTDERQFPRETRTGSDPVLKHPILTTKMEHSGLFCSKGYCSSYMGPLAAYGAHVRAVWFLGRWWHIYSSAIWVS